MGRVAVARSRDDKHLDMDILRCCIVVRAGVTKGGEELPTKEWDVGRP